MGSATKNQITRDELRRTVRLLDVHDGQVLAIKRGTSLANMDSINALSKAFASTKRGDVIIIVVDEFDDLTVLSEQQMSQAGWARRTLAEEQT